jgi:hypothetical protein
MSIYLVYLHGKIARMRIAEQLIFALSIFSFFGVIVICAEFMIHANAASVGGATHYPRKQIINEAAEVWTSLQADPQWRYREIEVGIQCTQPKLH